MKQATLALFALALAAGPAAAQQNVRATAANMYDIALNGDDVTIDANLDDWNDAQFLFFSQDEPNFLTAGGGPIQGVPESPADFSGFFAMKSDGENMYFAVRVRDEGAPLYDAPATPNLAFDFDHLSVYLGLYDIGESGVSPHVEAVGEEADNAANFQFLDADGNPFVATPGRTYRIGPGTDNSGTTLGPDHQFYIRALDYGGDGSVVMGDDVQTYIGGIVDSAATNTTAATRFLTDDAGTEVGYILEWQVPLASLAGDISSRPEFAGIEYPLYTPQDGDVIPFDYDVTDRDVPDGLNVFMRGSNNGALFRDSFNFGLRGRFVDLSQRGEGEAMSLLGKYFINYDEDLDVTIDGSTDEDWADARWIGFSQDEQNFLTAGGGPIQGVPESPADFSGFFSMQADSENLYFAVRVRDEGAPLYDAPATPNLAFDFDHLSVYAGLYNIGLMDGSPHVEAVGEEADNAANFQFLDADGNPFVATPGRTYRISPESDNSGTTLGPDYQFYIRALDYGGDGNVVMGDDVQTYIGGVSDTTASNTTASTTFLTDENGTEVGYILEWQVPLASLAGDISSRPEFDGIEYPEYSPTLGDIIPMDYDVTDRDVPDGLNVFMRGSNNGALFRDSFNFGLRGQFVDGSFAMANPVAEEDGPGRRADGRLEAPRPNPFSGSTRIAFTLAQAQDVRLEVFNLLGQRVAVLADGPLAAGDHLVPFHAAGLPAGVYLSRLTTADGEVRVAQMALVR